MANTLEKTPNSANSLLAMPWGRLFLVTFACYLPAFLLVGISYVAFRYAGSSQNSGEAFLTDLQKKQITEEVRKTSEILIAEEVKKNLESKSKEVDKIASQQQAISQVQTSMLAKGYIDGEIQKATKEQADKIQKEVDEKIEKTAKDEIDKLKADWKGDLFGQVAFPVVFAIASIFAAFAVKDILTEILKEQEKQKVKDELRNELVNQIVPNAIRSQSIIKRLEMIEIRSSWLEHHVLNTIMEEIISKVDFKAKQEVILPVIYEILEESVLSIDKTELIPEDLKKLKEARQNVLKAQITKNLRIDSELATKITTKIDGAFQEEHISTLTPFVKDVKEGLFQLEIGFLVAKLSELGEDSLIKDLLKYLKMDRQENFRKRQQEDEKEASKYKPELQDIP